jgi:hypothetical protein
MTAPPTDIKPSPLLHCENVYMKMRNDASEFHEGDSHMIVWEGFLTRLVKDLKLSVPYYSTIRTALMSMGCIRQLRRGGGTSPSQWELIKPPTMELWNKMQDELPASSRGPNASVNGEAQKEVRQLGQRLSDLTDRVGKLEEGLALVVNLFNENLQKGA